MGLFDDCLVKRENKETYNSFYKYVIYNMDCFDAMKQLNTKVDLILTSPPYNTGRNSTSIESRRQYESRYDVHIDNMSAIEYRNWCVSLFKEFDNILNKDRVILWNVSYGTDATCSPESLGLMWNVVSDIIDKTNFTVADRIVWKKKSALPNNSSKNKLTRITEDIFVFCRKSEILTFDSAKKIASIGANGQTFYENVMNYIECKNNDGSCILNKATFSSELVAKLLSIYCKQNYLVYDPFMGTGTTAYACAVNGIKCVGSELSEQQCEFAKNRLTDRCDVNIVKK